MRRPISNPRAFQTNHPRSDRALVNDANALLEALAGIDGTQAEEPVAAALALLALVAGQDVEPAEGFRRHRWPVAHRPQGRPRPGDIHGGPAMRGTPASRREARRDGYRAHVAAEPETGIITDEALTKAAGTENSDPAGGGEVPWPPTWRPRRRRPTRAAHREWYGDSAYGTGDLCAQRSTTPGTTAVIKPKPLTAPVEGGFTVDDFTIDEQAGTVGCPAGNTRPHEPDPGGQLRCAVPRLSSAATRCTDFQDRPQNRSAPTR